MNLKKKTLIATTAALGLTGVAGLAQNNASAANVNPQQSTATTQETSSPASAPTSQANSASSSTTTLSNFAQQHSGDSSASSLVSSTKQAKSNFLNNTYQDKEMSGKASIKHAKISALTAVSMPISDQGSWSTNYGSRGEYSPAYANLGPNEGYVHDSEYTGPVAYRVDSQDPSYINLFTIDPKTGKVDTDEQGVGTVKDGKVNLGCCGADWALHKNYGYDPYGYPSDDYPEDNPQSYNPDPSDSNQARLPQTGDSNFSSSILLGIMITILGTAITTFDEIKKRNE